MSKHFSHTNSFNIPVSVGFTALAHIMHMLNWYEICLNRTNYLIFNMPEFRYWLVTSMLDCIGQLVSPYAPPPTACDCTHCMSQGETSITLPSNEKLYLPPVRYNS